MNTRISIAIILLIFFAKMTTGQNTSNTLLFDEGWSFNRGDVAGAQAVQFDDSKKPGEKNIIAVQVKNEGRNSRWYSGSGIYRIVWLKNVAPVHVAQWGTFITTPVVNSVCL